jgi:hypothetical protein
MKSREGNGGKKEKGKSHVKVFTQTIIGRYLCPRSRAEIAKKATGENKKKGLYAKQVVLRQHAEKGLYANGRMQTETGLYSL